MKKILFFAAIFAVVGCTEKIAPTTGDIRGVVKDAETVAPIVGCAITLVPSGRTTVTGADGVYHFEDVPPEQYSVEATSYSYYGNKKSVVLAAGDAINVDFLLMRYDPNNRLPTLGAMTVSEVTYNSARVFSEVLDQGSSSVSERGFLYSDQPNPSMATAIKKSLQGGTGTFSATITGLQNFTDYYIVPYAMNARGVNYGDQVRFTTGDANTITAPANVIYVSVSGNNANDGSSWSKAKKTIATAVEAAIEGKQIWVSVGNYRETVSPKSGIPIYGGFKGSEKSIEQRVERTSVNSINIAGCTTPTLVDGFSVQNENLSDGIGMSVGDNARLRNCLISSNTSNNSTAIILRVLGTSSEQQPIVENCIIENNKEPDYGRGITKVYGHATFIGCIVRGNRGSAIYPTYHPQSPFNGSLSMYNCVITNNAFGINIGELMSSVSSPNLYNCTIANNTFAISGERSMNLYNCLVWNSPISSGSNVNQYSCIVVPTADNSGVKFTKPSSSKGIDATDWSAADWSIEAGSSCINAGTSLYFPVDSIPTDIAGNPRITGGAIDVGAYEW